MEATLYVPTETEHWTQESSCTMGTGSFPGVKRAGWSYNTASPLCLNMRVIVWPSRLWTSNHLLELYYPVGQTLCDLVADMIKGGNFSCFKFLHRHFALTFVQTACLLDGNIRARSLAINSVFSWLIYRHSQNFTLKTSNVEWQVPDEHGSNLKNTF
jgi:hypothetical protein